MRVVRLVLRLPTGWATQTVDGGRTRVTVAPSVSLELEPLIPRPDELEPWVRTLLVRGIDPAWHVDIDAKQDGTTEVGWPMTTYRLRVREPVRETPDACSVVFEPGCLPPAPLSAFSTRWQTPCAAT